MRWSSFPARETVAVPTFFGIDRVVPRHARSAAELHDGVTAGVSATVLTMSACRAARQAQPSSKTAQTSRHCSAAPAAHQIRHLTGE